MKNRVVIRLYGFVQGVNMRAMIKVKSISLGLFGYVKNNDDSSVEIIVEGDKENIEELIRWLNILHGPAKIEKLEDYWSESNNEFNDFQIKY